MQTQMLPPKKRKDRDFDPSNDESTVRLVSSDYDSEDSEDSESEDSEDSQDTGSDPEWTPSPDESDNPDTPDTRDTPDTPDTAEPVKKVPAELLPLALDAPPEAGVRVHEDARRPKFLPADYTVKYTSHVESANPTPEDTPCVWTPMASYTRRADGGGGKVKPVAASAKFGTRLNPTMGHSQRAKSRYGIPKAYLVPSTAVRQSIVAALEKACSTWVRGQNIKPMPVNDPSWVYVSPDGKTDPRPYRFVKQELPQGGYYLYCPSTYPPSEVDGSHYYALTTTELRDAFLEDSAFQEHNAVTKKQLLDVKNRRKRDNVPTIEMRMKIERYTAGRNAREMAQAAIGATEKQVQQQQLEQEIQMLKAAIAARQQQLEQQAQTSVAMAVGGD